MKYGVTTTQANYFAIVETLQQVTNENWIKYQEKCLVRKGNTLMVDLPNGGGDMVRKYRTIGIKASDTAGFNDFIDHWIIGNHNAQKGVVLYIHRDRKSGENLKMRQEGVKFETLWINDLREHLLGNQEATGVSFDIGFIENCQSIVVQDADIVLNRCGVTQHEFNKWVYSVFGTQPIIIHLN